jgi:uncharacterized membrane protein YagU involved in acid resistance
MNMVTPMLKGALGGLVAVAPMTLTMALLHGKSPWHRRDPLPPREITEEMAERVGLRDELSEQQVRAASTVNHFAYGAATGSAYGIIARRLAMPPVASGVLFAACVWTLSYLGWLPALRIMPPATEQRGSRNALMIAAHVVWGASMGLLFALLDRRRDA